MGVDQGVRRLAAASANFGFLLPHQPLLVLYGAGAEAVVFADPNGALVKARQFAEVLAQELITRAGIAVKSDKLATCIEVLAQNGVLTASARRALDDLRLLGNAAVHEHLADRREALRALRTCFDLGDLIDRALTDFRGPRGFVPPTPPVTTDPAVTERLRGDLERYQAELAEVQLRLEGSASRLAAEQAARQEAQQLTQRAFRDAAAARALVAELTEQLASLQAAQDARFERLRQKPERVTAEQRELLAEAARRPRPLTEAQVRIHVDAMLRRAGWVVQDHAVMNPGAGQGVAVREYPLAGGRTDYALYVGKKLVGVIEAKREGTGLGDAEWQSQRYAGAAVAADAPAAWRPGTPLPFRYETNGAEVHLTNGLDPYPRSREVFSFHRPETVARWMREADADAEAPTLRAKLRRMPEPATERLRPAQIDAVRGLERSLAEDRPRALVQMATGAGKTFTAATESYRLLRHANAERILFLVDRNTLGRQTRREFQNYDTPDDGRKFTELYNVELLSGRGVPESSKVVISTIQRMYAMLRGEDVPEGDDPAFDLDAAEESSAAAHHEDEDTAASIDVSYNPQVPPETFDVVIVDECHRSIYGRWRPVLEYFDAHIIGLTATPVKQTFGFFHRNLVSEYTYEESVLDGVNVDFDVFRIRTEMTEQGATIEAGSVVPKRDRRTRHERMEELEEDYTYTGTQIGRSVIAPDQIRLVLTTFRDSWRQIWPGREVLPKTLVFAKDDNHAEEILTQVREIFGRGNDFAAKITYKARQSGRSPEDLIQEFRNGPNLRVAVTVDMIATGTDIRPLECVLFLRDVKSPVLFEQMKGRGARTIDPDEYQSVTPDARAKDRFVIVDAVGVTDSPLVEATPLQRHDERSQSLQKLLSKAARLDIQPTEVATLASRLARLNQQLDDTERAELEKLAGQPLTAVVAGMKQAADPEQLEAARAAGDAEGVRALIRGAVQPLSDNPGLRQRLLETRRAHDITIDDVNADTLISAEGVPRERIAAQTLTSWHDFLEAHRDEIAIQEIIQGRRGGRSVFLHLKALAEAIRRPPYVWTPQKLWEAYEIVGRAAHHRGVTKGPLELVTLIRYELGLDAELTPYRSQIEERYRAWQLRQQNAGAEFTPAQLWWLDRLVDVIATDAGIDPHVLDQLPFTDRGGTDGFLAAFGDDRAAGVLADLEKGLTA